MKTDLEQRGNSTRLLNGITTWHCIQHFLQDLIHYELSHILKQLHYVVTKSVCNICSNFRQELYDFNFWQAVTVFKNWANKRYFKFSYLTELILYAQLMGFDLPVCNKSSNKPKYWFIICGLR